MGLHYGGLVMRRFIVKPEAVRRDASGHPHSLRLYADEAWHLARVLRLAQGDAIVAMDGLGMEYEATLTKVSAQQVEAAITAVCRSLAETKMPLILFQGLPKADKMDFIVQKSTELGVAAIYPVITKRVVTKLDQNKAQSRVARWERIAREAAKQSGRAVCPAVASPVSLPQAITVADLSYLLVPWEEAEQPLATVLAKMKQELPNSIAELSQMRIGLVIGPEGGFSREEVEQLVALGGQAVTLGPRILRTETAGIVALSAILFALGELGGP